MSPNSDSTFRMVLLIGSALLFPAAFYYRLKSQASGEKLDRRQEGMPILLTLRPIALAGMLGLVVFMVNPAAMAWSSMRLPDWLRWSGVGLGIAGGALL